MRAATEIQLEDMSREYQARTEKIRHRITVCVGTGCMANGALKVAEALKAAAASEGLEVVVDLKAEVAKPDLHLSKSGCQGFCQMGPLVTIHPEQILYCGVRPEDAGEVIRATCKEGQSVERLLYKDPGTGNRCAAIQDIPFYANQHRVVLKECGRIDPEDITEYVAKGGYMAARKTFMEMEPEAVVKEILASGLQGRGGGGFPSGRKWEAARIQPGDRKFVICNGDEGDPGAFMDRAVMEGNPHAVLEGVMIAGRAIGAAEGYVYVRAEYPLAVKRVRKAVADAEAAGILGEDVFGSGKGFRIRVMEGAGAFVCGEETALIASIEGRRGMPMPKPPFPAQSGLWGCPTVINNVETLATVPSIMREGSTAFRSLGTEKSPGTKTFALTGDVVNTGLIEVPFGTSLRDVVFGVGGGVLGKDGRPTRDTFKAVQIGGPSGGCLTKKDLDLNLDNESLTGIGAMLGSGGLVVMNQDTCMVQTAKYFMRFTQNETCGKCVPCREGTKQMLYLLEEITEGRADEKTLELLELLARNIRTGSLCGLGKTAPNPVLSIFKNFREELEAHVHRKVCPARKCKALLTPEIEGMLCKGCSLCVRKCPVGAITGERKRAHHIDPNSCIRCGACLDACKFGAIKGL
jgi:NADH-quinone oxidoreductase subunit F